MSSLAKLDAAGYDTRMPAERQAAIASPPEVVAHADWSAGLRDRSLAVARLDARGVYRVGPPEPPGKDLLRRLATDGRLLIGFDFPIGLPRAFAARARIATFPTFLRDVDEAAWTRFREPNPPDVLPSMSAPFYPRRPGGARRAAFAEGLGIPYPALLRRCDRPTDKRLAACMTFWTLGAQQCGRAALAGWHEIIRPALRNGHDVALWPFDGDLARLLATRRIVVAETYPAECYGQLLELPRPWSKRRARDRAAMASQLLDRLLSLNAEAEPALMADLRHGLDGDHAFDAVVGLLGLLSVVRGRRGEGVPERDPAVRAVEGWMIGLRADYPPGSAISRPV